MRVLISSPGSDPVPWLDALREILPQTTFEVWAPGAAQADVALVWMPPQAMLDEQTRLRALINLGAGVDGLLRLRVDGLEDVQALYALERGLLQPNLVGVMVYARTDLETIWLLHIAVTESHSASAGRRPPANVQKFFACSQVT